MVNGVWGKKGRGTKGFSLCLKGWQVEGKVAMGMKNRLCRPWWSGGRYWIHGVTTF